MNLEIFQNNFFAKNRKSKLEIFQNNFFAKNRKAVSPIVATILLVAIVIVIALIIFLWVRGITGDYGEKFGKNVELVCEDVNIDASYSGGTLFITNDGNVPVFKINVKMSKLGSHSTVELESLLDEGEWGSAGLGQGDVFSETVNFDDSTEVLLIPVLIAESGEGGKKSFTCDEAYGKQIILE